MERNKQRTSGKMKLPPLATMTVTEDTKPYDCGYEYFDRGTRWNDTHRGPILRVVTPSMELQLKFFKKPKSSDETNFENESEAISEGSGSRKTVDLMEAEYVHESPEPFSATPKCKQMRLVLLTNEGTTAIRYQWLRFPPSKAMRTMLANPRTYLNLNSDGKAGEQDTTLSNPDNFPPGPANHLSKPRKALNPSVSDMDFSTPRTSCSGSNDQLPKVRSSTSLELEKAKEIIGKKPGFLRDASFDFHFREMPGILLPGQKYEMPILYRPRKAGYCHENLYLLTHPRLTDEFDRTFMIRLTGICMEPDCPSSNKDKDTGKEKERTEPDCVKRTVTKAMLELEGADLMDSVLDHALYMKQKRNPSTLPFGKLTPESIFYAHNPFLYYHYGVAERALKTVRKLIQVLIPLHRIQMEENEICSLSIKDLYRLLWTKPEDEDFFRSRFKTTKTEKLLRRLAKCNRILTRPPIFAYANAGARKHMACYANMVGVLDGIFEKMDSIKENFTETPLYRIQRGQLEQNIRKRRLREFNRAMNKEKRQKYQMAKCLGKEVQENENEIGTSAFQAEPGEFETGSEYETEFPFARETDEGTTNPPTGQGTKDVEPQVSGVENYGTATEEETAELRESSPGAEMEFIDEETASGPDETLEADEEEAVIVVTPPKEEEDKEPEKKGKKSSTEKGKPKKESETSDKDNIQLRKGKKTKRERSKLEKPESLSKKTKGGKKEKKQKSSSLQEEKGGGGGEVEDNGSESKNSPLNKTITPDSLDDDVPEEQKKTTEEFIYGDVEGEVEELLRVRTEKKIRQARLIAFENMLGCGIERMLSFVDTMRNFYDYRTSEFYPGEKYCCHQEWN